MTELTNGKIENWFSIPIYHCFVNFSYQEAISKEISSELEKLQTNDLDNPWNDGVKTSFKHNAKNNFLQKSNDFMQIIGSHCSIFCNQLDVNANYIEISESWINLSEYNDYQHFHNHVPSVYDISGVYYDKTKGDGSDGKIEFKNPNLASQSSILLSHFSNVSFIPENGKLILFPSFLEHCVYKNTSEQTRISISFNVKVGL